jgi:biofilm protein TabA
MKPDYSTFSRIHRAVDYLNSHDISSLPNGRTVIDDDIYINVMEADTKRENIFEAHREYIDIHYIIEGEEKILTAPVEKMTVTREYSSGSDSLLGTAYTSDEHVIRKGQYCITMPEEAHSPCRMVTAPSHIRKAVFKVRY